MAKPTHELVATIGEYTDRKTGEKKKRRLKVGTVWLDDQGRESILIEAFPVSREWSGWLSKFEIREREG
jgi:hypothetical protein